MWQHQPMPPASTALPSGSVSDPAASHRAMPAMTSRCWAWEFLRRNAAHADALERAGRQIELIGTCGGVRLLRSAGVVPTAVPGCLYASAALSDGVTADVLWDPVLCPSVLQAVAIAADPSLGMPVFTLERPGLAGALLLTASGRQHLVLRQGLQQLQLSVLGADLSAPVHILPADSGASEDRPGQIRGWHALRDLLRTGQLPEWSPPMRRSSRRLYEVLTALDGWRAGWPHRDIALDLFGYARVTRDWADPHGCLRDRVRRAIARGRHLSTAGYLQLLKYS